jgi:hypothetical protein
LIFELPHDDYVDFKLTLMIIVIFELPMMHTNAYDWGYHIIKEKKNRKTNSSFVERNTRQSALLL